jgi:hypothetical protein
MCPAYVREMLIRPKDMSLKLLADLGIGAKQESIIVAAMHMAAFLGSQGLSSTSLNNVFAFVSIPPDDHKIGCTLSVRLFHHHQGRSILMVKRQPSIDGLGETHP